MRFGLKATDIDLIQKVLILYKEVEKAVIYGSRAMGTNRPSSNIDLTLFGEKLNLTFHRKIERDLDDLLLPVTFDTSIFKQISNPDVIAHINRVGKVLYEKSEHANNHRKA